jgi:transcriptional regulator with XRE-family HTH domain
MTEEVDKVAFGKRVAERRIALGLSQTDLATAAGMKQQGVASIEKGDVERPRKLKEIAETLGVSEDYLLYAKGDLTEDGASVALRARVAVKLKQLKLESLQSILDQAEFFAARDQGALPPRGEPKE